MEAEQDQQPSKEENYALNEGILALNAHFQMLYAEKLRRDDPRSPLSESSLQQDSPEILNPDDTTEVLIGSRVTD